MLRNLPGIFGKHVYKPLQPSDRGEGLYITQQWNRIWFSNSSLIFIENPITYFKFSFGKPQESQSTEDQSVSCDRKPLTMDHKGQRAWRHARAILTIAE
jgi:hypothetical protein